MADVASLNSVALDFMKDSLKSAKVTDNSSDDAFSSIFNAAMDMVGETDALAKDAEEAQIQFALGNSENTHDLTIAQQKAYLSLQYTVAVKNQVLEAYKEIMNMQI